MKKIIRLAALLISACVLATAAGAAEAGLLRDVPYGSDARQRMDVYLPPQAHDAPAIFMVHGGAWRTGDKAAASVVANKVAHWLPAGYALISVNYRLLPDADPLRQADDITRALAYAQMQAPAWGIDPARFVLMGHSAGAHLVDILAAAPAHALSLGARPWLGTVSLDSAVLDVERVMARRHYRFYDAAFGADPAYWQSVSPQHLLAAGAAPLLLVCSSTRPDHPCAQTHDFADRAQALGVRAEVLEEPLTHREINAALGAPGSYTAAVDAFLRALP